MNPSKSSSNSMVHHLIFAPWWISILLAVIGSVFLKWILPTLEIENKFLQIFAVAAHNSAYLVALFFTLLAGVSAYRSWRVKTQFEMRESLDTLIHLGWKEFEDLTGELFRRRGFKVEETLGGGADGGVDLRLKKGTATTLVQCKRWKSKKVGLPIVRELLGAMTAENAQNGILVTTSNFTKDAEAFARKYSIELIDGESLLPAIKEVQRSIGTSASKPASQLPNSATPDCPNCGGRMVLRIAKRGANQGGQFWGCETFPKCRGMSPF
jgi:restriction system protein